MVSVLLYIRFILIGKPHTMIFNLIMQHGGFDAKCEVTIRWIPPEPH